MELPAALEENQVFLFSKQRDYSPANISYVRTDAGSVQSKCGVHNLQVTVLAVLC